MSTSEDRILKSIIRDMSEGVIVLGLDGVIRYINPAAEHILDVSGQSLMGRKFATVFIKRSENDDFNQTVLDAIYDPESKHYSLVPYCTGDVTRQLHVMTSLMMDGDSKEGVIMVISDITELAELKIRYAEQITILLDSLVKAVSTAIDERSPYNANHTRNMARMGEAFLDWLDQTGNSWHFDDDQRRAFLMSVWLHDVGKLVVPLEIMNKATRLGTNLERIEDRFEKLRLMDRIAALEGRITESQRQTRQAERDDQLKFIRKVNIEGFLPDEDLDRVRLLAQTRYVDGDGEEKPLFTEEEVADLSIRRGTLTAEERCVMQSHASVTGRILSSVQFPETYAMVPVWAAAHHEFLNGVGYPNHLNGDEVPKEVRLLTILDIFEALTAKDRPYKKPMSLERAESILCSMWDEGCLDGEILQLFLESHAWKTIIH